MSNDSPEVTPTDPIGVKDIDVARIVEATLLGAIILVGRLIVTTWDYFVHPARLADLRPRIGFASPYARPVTFFAVSSILTLGMFALLFQAHPTLDNVSPGDKEFPIGLLKEALSSGEVKKLALILAPLLAAVSLFAIAAQQSARKRSLQLDFETSLAFSCYCAGSILLVFFLFVPLMPLLRDDGASLSIPWWGYVASGAGWAPSNVHQVLHCAA